MVALFVFLMLGFIALGARLVVVQVVDSPAYARLASQQRAETVQFPARRGTILDRNGEWLAISVDLQMVYADPELVKDPRAEARTLAPLLHQPVEDLEAKLSGTRPGSRFEYVAHGVEPDVARAIRREEPAGIFLEPEPKRHYPNHRLASQVLGFVGTDGTGLSGIEAQYESILAGRRGHMSLEEDPSGRPLPQARFVYERARAGRSLFLTIDKNIQFHTQQAVAQAAHAYHAEAASAVVMDPETGEVLAMAGVPDFDPNHFQDFSEEAFKNRALTDVYEPGSSYKVVAAAAALEEGVVTPRSRFVVPDELPYIDRVFHDSHTHPTEDMSVREIIEQSSNVGTIKIGLELGGAKLDEYVRKFGFGAPTGLDFPAESSGIVLPRDRWSGVTVATVPIGQGIAVTTMQMASAYATLANDGVRVEPKLLYASADSSARVRRSSPPASRRVVSPATARRMTRILAGAVARGTGIEARIPGYVAAGKTGTAQKPLPTGGYGSSYVASFAGYAPAEDPAIVVVVVLDDPSPIWGGETAAPTFRSIAEYALRRLGVSPSSNAARAAEELAASEGLTDAHD